VAEILESVNENRVEYFFMAFGEVPFSPPIYQSFFLGLKCTLFYSVFGQRLCRCYLHYLITPGVLVVSVLGLGRGVGFYIGRAVRGSRPASRHDVLVSRSR